MTLLDRLVVLMMMMMVSPFACCRVVSGGVPARSTSLLLSRNHRTSATATTTTAAASSFLWFQPPWQRFGPCFCHTTTPRRRRSTTTTLCAANNNQSNNSNNSNNNNNNNWMPQWLQTMGSRTNVLNPQSTPKSRDETTTSRRRRLLLTEALLQECRRSPRPGPAEHRRAIESRIQELIESSSSSSFTTATAASPRLPKKWKVVYTTEKEINFFLNTGLAREIYQTLRGNDQLRNEIPFVRGQGAYFRVQGRRVPCSKGGVRTEFEFTTAILNLGPPWGEYRFPPVGKGWFDTIYLDDSLRIDRNSRQDILICLAAAEPEEE